METISKDLISLLQYLLPGFISAWVFYALTSYKKPSQFERIVQALIFTVVIQALIYLVKVLLLFAGRVYTVAVWYDELQLIWSILCAVLLGFIFSYSANNDKLHKVFRKLNLTRETSYASEWYGAFFNNVTYVVLHFKDERRLYGWPTVWPSEPNSGHFQITEASWLNEENKEIPITGVESILVSSKDVKWVEFMKTNWEKEHGKEGS